MVDDFDIGQSLGRIEETLKNQGESIKDIQHGVADYRKLKNRLIGICVGVSLLISVVWKSFWKVLG